MQPFDQLQDIFMKFPGIGKRQARRLVFFLLQQDPSFRNNLSRLVESVNKNMHLCQNSFQFFYSPDPETLSPLERDLNRDRTQLMIVEKDMDLEAIEKSKTYKGLYFILGGLLPVIKEDTSHLRTSKLMERITRGVNEHNLSEIIMAFSYNPESEHTRLYLIEKLKPLVDTHKLKISTLGRGLSTGSELEYSDSDTLRHALESRK